MTNQQAKYPSSLTPFINMVGGMAGWALVHPSDLIKTHMARGGQKVTFMQAAGKLYSEAGVLGFYNGLSAGLARQVVYAPARLTLYEVFRDLIVTKGEKPTVPQRIGAGAVSGGIAAVLSCPAEVSLVRMQSDHAAPPEARRGYTSVFNALSRIAREEGVATYWRGSSPTVVRAIAVGVSQVAFYDQSKAWLYQYGGFTGTPQHLLASLMTGLFYSACTMPIETVKVRMQNQRPQEDGTLKYRSVFPSMATIVKEEGPRGLFRGYLPYYGRCGGHTIGCFMAIEQLKRAAGWMYSSRS
eukprot:TRINITY_DN112773_c0_g1_i1.p1 TRINITY_DN112773_c0_g1~~TRINITY_DN112773_c0_g1_i1.p1  ORF type:complete len:298 (-),score=30.07 TRINITY_DN112773_c0_g1_i1:82-975(-)